MEFFDRFGLDAVDWVFAWKPDESRGDYCDPAQGEIGYLETQRICSGSWMIESEELPGDKHKTTRFRIVTPERTLSMVLQEDVQTAWVAEHLIKEKSDMELIEKYAPVPLCDIEQVNQRAAALGERGIIRGAAPSFDIYGQPGCWQDAAVLFGIEQLIMETYYDPAWVKAFLGILKERKKRSVGSMAGAPFAIIELGGGDASSTVISPKIFEEFVAPFDSELIATAHNAGQRVVYHTCGGMMPLLELIAGMNPDAIETFTPPAMGGDVDLREAKQRIGGRVCMIGGFDQFHYFVGCQAEATQREVRRCFEEAGGDGAYILAPSDHFFEAEPELLTAYAGAARDCIY